jgi:hypothetical protein
MTNLRVDWSEAHESAEEGFSNRLIWPRLSGCAIYPNRCVVAINGEDFQLVLAVGRPGTYNPAERIVKADVENPAILSLNLKVSSRSVVYDQNRAASLFIDRNHEPSELS